MLLTMQYLLNSSCLKSLKLTANDVMMRTCCRIQAVRIFLVADLEIASVCPYHFEIKNILELTFSRVY